MSSPVLASAVDCALLRCPFSWSWSNKADLISELYEIFWQSDKIWDFFIFFLVTHHGKHNMSQTDMWLFGHFINSLAGRGAICKLWLSDLKEKYSVSLNGHDMKQFMRSQLCCLWLLSHWKLPLYYQTVFTAASVDILVTDLAVSIVAWCVGLALHESNFFRLRLLEWENCCRLWLSSNCSGESRWQRVYLRFFLMHQE